MTAGIARLKTQATSKMSMKKALVLLAALAVGAGLYAQSDASRSSYSITSDFTYTSKYVFRGLGLAKDSFQPSVEVSADNLYADIWTNLPITKHQDDTIEFKGGYRERVGHNLTLEALGTYYWYPEAHTGLTRHSLEGGFGATYAAAGFSPSIYYYHDFELRSDTGEGALGYSIPLPDYGTEVDLSLYDGTTRIDKLALAPGVLVRESYNYYGADLTIPYHVSEHAKITAGVHWAASEQYLHGLGRNRYWFDIGFAAGF